MPVVERPCNFCRGNGGAGDRPCPTCYGNGVVYVDTDKPKPAPPVTLFGKLTKRGKRKDESNA